MARRSSKKRLQEFYEAVSEHPGRRPGFFARLLGVRRSQVTRRLPVMEEHGYLLSEDSKGGLWPFRRV